MDWKKINHIAFDADDTLWSLEAQFWEIERRFLALLAPYGSADALAEKLVAVERGNHPVYGYGVKSFTLSMIETALACSGGRIPAEDVGRILDFGKTLLNAPVIPFADAEPLLAFLCRRCRLIVATKGDLLDQERKLKNSGLLGYFHHIEIMSEKKTADYRKLLKHLDASAQEFLMVGNSMSSDILPVLELGGSAIHIPAPVPLRYPDAPADIVSPRLLTLGSLAELFRLISHKL